MKNVFRVVAIIAVTAILFGVGFTLGSQKGITVQVSVEQKSNPTVNTANTTPTQAPTTAPSTEAPTQAEASEDDSKNEDTKEDAKEDTNTDTKKDDTKKEEKSDSKKSGSIPQTTEEIVEAYNKAIAETKKVQDVTIRKTEKVGIHVTSCSVSFATSAIDSVVQKFISDIDETYEIKGGNGTNPTNGNPCTTDSVTPPYGRTAELKAEGISSATCEAKGDGYTIKFTLVPEVSSYDGQNTVRPDNNFTVADVLDLATLDVSPAQITHADMKYPGSSYEADINANGTVDRLACTIPMSGEGTGKLGVSLTVGLEGQLVDEFTYTY